MATEPYNPSPIGNPSVLARRNWWQIRLVILIGKYTPKCRDMVRILSRSMDEPMSLSMRIKKRFHFLICCWCQRYEEQLHYMHDVAHAFPEHADVASTVQIPVQTKERWKSALRATPPLTETNPNDRSFESNPGQDHRDSDGAQRRFSWTLLFALAAAAMLLVAALLMRMPAPSARSLAEFRDEMVSFVKVDPSLEMKSGRLPELMEWVRDSRAPSGFVIPAAVQSMEPVGCRVLRFRGHDVTLICFRRDNGSLLHFFVMDRAGMPGLPTRERAKFVGQGEWMTATWAEGNLVYLMAVQGDEPMLERLLNGT